MSLNGLDNPDIKEAYDFAVAEPGGWFLLNYIARDEIDLFNRGNGGIVDIRNAIAKYEDPSPLYGFLKYRRRNVIIKYVPEECSRLVKAHVSVHFIAVTERFSPHDTEFSIISAKELRDTTLSAACSLHTASGSISSSTSSLRRRRLMEIAEDEEEDLRAKRQSTVPEERPSTGKTIPTSDLPTTVELPDLPTGGEPSAAYLSSPDSGSFPPPRVPYSPAKSIGEGRRSSQSTRPDLYNTSSYGSVKPKVKLGPRPSLDIAGRPHTSGAASYHRPVSTLPAGLKVSKVGSKEADRPHSLYPEASPSMTMSPPALPETLLLPGYDGIVRPRTSSGRPASSQSMRPPAPPSPSASMFAKVPTITLEKSKLLKAMEMRKKQMNARKTASLSLAASSMEQTVRDVSPISSRLSVVGEKVEDSGVALESIITTQTEGSDATRSDSYPVSPAVSEHGESTKASSISNSTDETIQEADTCLTKDSLKKESLADEDMVGPEIKTETLVATKDTPEAVISPTSAVIKRESLQKLYPTVYDPFAIYKEPEVHAPVDTPAMIEEREEQPVVVSKVEHEEPTPKAVENYEETTTLSQDILDHSSTPTFDEQIKPAAQQPPITEKQTEALSTQQSDQAMLLSPSAIALPASPMIPAIIPMEEPVVVSPREEQKEMPMAEFLKVSPPGANAQDPVLEVPTSVISTEVKPQDVPLPEPSLEVPTSITPMDVNPRDVSLQAPSPVGSTFSLDAKRSMSVDRQGMTDISSKQRKRKAQIDPIMTDLILADRNGGDSDNFSSDDEFMDELQSAVFHDAQPISVSKSPITPVFPSPKKKKPNSPSKFLRAVSNPIKKEPLESKMLEIPSSTRSQFPLRSVSAGAAYLNRIKQQADKPMPKKVNLGGSISQRIKALERMSSLPPGATSAATTAPNAGASTSFFSVRKPGIRSSSQASNHTDSNNSIRQTPSPKSSPEALKIINRSGSMKSRLDKLNSNPSAAAGLTGRSRPESVSVTARIVRDPAQPFPSKPQLGKDPSDYAPVNFKQSPLVIDHQKAVVEPVKETIHDRRQSRERRLSTSSKTTTNERRSSVAVIKDLISDGRASFSEKRRSIHLEPVLAAPVQFFPSRPPSTHQSHQSPGRRPSSVSSRRNSRDLAAGFSPPPTAGSMSSTSDDRSEKKASRTSRILGRMSNTISVSRKTISHAMSPTVREESEPPSLDFMSPTSTQPQEPPTPINTSVGDVNVQFPDSLLWKRRSMVLDSAGYLILSPALSAQGKQTVAPRKFHMSEFRTPAIPDMDMEELPNSVTLDFIEGCGLQIACEDRAGQGRVLKILLETHRTWAAYGQ